MENKMTYVMAIDNALNGVLDDATVDKLNALKVQLNKKSKSGSSKPSKVQVYNAEVVQPSIIKFLEGVDSATATEVAKGVSALVGTDITTSKATANLSKLKENGKVVRTIAKRVAYYSLV